MIKNNPLKPIVLDKYNFLQDIKNWSLLESEFSGLEYEDEECSTTYEFESFWKVGDDEYQVWSEVYHRWVEDYDPGDYYTVPYYEIVHEDLDVYVVQICNEEGDVIDTDSIEMKILVAQLESRIESTLR